VNDKEILRNVGIGSKELCKIYGFKNMNSWYQSPNRVKYTAAAASIVRSTAQYLLNKKK